MTDTNEVRTVLVTDADVQLLDAALFVLRSADLLQERRSELGALRDRIAGRYVSAMEPLPPIASVSLSIDPEASAAASRRFIEAAYPRGEVL